MGKVKAIIFDFDGVIHNTFDLAYGIHKKLNPGLSKEHFRSHFDGNLFKFIDKNPNKEPPGKFRELEHKAFKKLKLENKIRGILAELAKNYRLYIISSNSSNNLNMYFENNNFTNVFEEILAVETHKSKSEKFKILFKKYNLTPNSCIFVTDTLGDILEAKKIGVKSIACTFGFHEKERLEKGKPYRIVSSFDEVVKTIKEIDSR